MTSIRQYDKTLHEYYNAINQALNTVITKIVLEYQHEREQAALITEAQRKAIRTFIVGLRSQIMRHILYGQQPKTLQEAYAIAQTVHYDSDHLQLNKNPAAKAQPRIQAPQQMGVDTNQPRGKLETGDKGINNANQFKQNWQKQENKREYYQGKPQGKIQKINQVTDDKSDDEGNIEEDAMSNVSIMTQESSAFLDE